MPKKSKKTKNFSSNSEETVSKKKVKTFKYKGITYNTSAFSSDENSSLSSSSSSTSSDETRHTGLTTLHKLQDMTSNLNNNSDFLSSSDNSSSSSSSDNISKRKKRKNKRKRIHNDSVGSSESESTNNSNDILFDLLNVPGDDQNLSQLSSSTASSDSSRKKKKQKTKSKKDPLDLTEFDDVAYPRRDCEWNMEKDYEEDKDEHDKHFKPCISTFDLKIEELLKYGESLDPTECWGCDYQDPNGTGIFAKHWNIIISMFCEGLLKTHPAILARQLYEYFIKYTIVEINQFSKGNDKVNSTIVSKIKVSTVKNVWSAYGMMSHLINHNLDPWISTVVDLWKLKMLKKDHFAEAMQKRHDVTGRKETNHQAICDLKSLIQIENGLYNRKPDKMLCYNKNRHLKDAGYSIISNSRPIINTFCDTSLFRRFG